MVSFSDKNIKTTGLIKSGNLTVTGNIEASHKLKVSTSMSYHFQMV